LLNHVKGKIGQSIRDAISQIINSAQLIRSLSLNRNTSIIFSKYFETKQEQLKKPKFQSSLETESKSGTPRRPHTVCGCGHSKDKTIVAQGMQKNYNCGYRVNSFKITRE